MIVCILIKWHVTVFYLQLTFYFSFHSFALCCMFVCPHYFSQTFQSKCCSKRFQFCHSPASLSQVSVITVMHCQALLISFLICGWSMWNHLHAYFLVSLYCGYRSELQSAVSLFSEPYRQPVVQNGILKVDSYRFSTYT